MRSIAALAIVLPLVTVAVAQRDDRTEAARKEVRSLIRDEIGRAGNIVFQSSQMTGSARGEGRVTGRGYFTRQGNNGNGNGNGNGNRRGNGNAQGNGNNRKNGDFTFSVDVRNSGREVRNALVTLDNGRQLRGDRNWSTPRNDDNGNGRDPVRPGRDDVRIDRPADNFVDKDGTVTFSGTSDRDTIELRIYDSQNREIAIRRPDVRNGRWDASVDVADGLYRAAVRAGRGRDVDEVRFGVDRNGDGNTNGARRATFDKPEGGFRDSDGDVLFEGRSGGSRVTLTIYQGNRQVSSRRVDVRDGRWRTNLRLGNASYRATVTSESGGRADEVRFSVGR